MLSLEDVACRRDGVLLFERASLVVQRGWRVGVSGANGSGKSSLFAMIAGELEPDRGAIRLPRGVGITHVAQETAASAESALEHVIAGDRRLAAIRRAIDACGDADGARRAALLGELEEAGGWTARARAAALLDGLGFAPDVIETPLASFSGGWRMRLALARALFAPNELLLLDEPTNHLDLDAVLWLEDWLARRVGTLLLISHDRAFLDAVTTHTIRLERGTLALYKGGYSAAERERAARLASAQALHERQSARRRELEAFVTRFRAKASKARQAQSRLKMLERMGETEAVRVERPFRFAFERPRAMPDPLVALEAASLGYGEETVLEGLSLALRPGERVGLLGANGAGKSTLVKALVGELRPCAGERRAAPGLAPGYFAQHQVERLLPERSALESLLAARPELAESAARDALGGFGFPGDDALRPVATLSGGERARLALALIVAARPNLLLLDEPTNHLDMDMRQALTEALQGFDGALVVISHDRALLGATVDALWLIADAALSPFDDDLDGYARWLAARRAARAPDIVEAADRAAVDGALTRRERRREEAARRERLAPMRREVERGERALENASARLERLRARLAAPDLYTVDGDRDALAGLLEEEGDARRAVAELEESLLEAMERLEHAEAAEEPR